MSVLCFRSSSLGLKFDSHRYYNKVFIGLLRYGIVQHSALTSFDVCTSNRVTDRSELTEARDVSGAQTAPGLRVTSAAPLRPRAVVKESPSRHSNRLELPRSSQAAQRQIVSILLALTALLQLQLPTKARL